MTCYNPLHASMDEQGTVHWTNNGRGNPITFPCGQCLGCRIQKSAEWAMRIIHETKSHEHSEFITLTYGSTLSNPSLHYPDFQRFLKRLRKQFFNQKIRFFVAGEYGPHKNRPHWHAILFGVQFTDKKVHKITSKGHRLYRSATLEKLWPLGFSTVAEVNFKTAQYCAAYTTQKVTGALADDHYRYTCPETGEISQLRPEFARMSTSPGLGADFYQKHHEQITAHDHIISNGVPVKPPRYYDKLLRRRDPHEYDLIKSERTSGGIDPTLNSPERLHAKETIKRAQLALNTTDRGTFDDN